MEDPECLSNDRTAKSGQYDLKEVTPRRKTVQPTRNQSKNPSRRKDRLSVTLLDTYLSRKNPARRKEEASETESVKESVGVTEFTRTFYSDDPMLRLLEAVADSRPLLLLWDSEGRKQMVDENELWELFTRMRKVLWDVPHAKNSINYHRIVQEFPPLGSRFTPKGEYFHPRRHQRITRTMRMRVMEIKNEYATEGRDQKNRTSQTEKGKSLYD